MKGRHPLRSTSNHLVARYKLQTEPRAGASRGHVHADEDVGDEVARGGDDVRRRRGWAGPPHPLQQGGNLFLRDARDDDPERPRGTRREGARLEHVAAFRQRCEEAFDRSEQPLRGRSSRRWRPAPPAGPQGPGARDTRSAVRRRRSAARRRSREQAAAGTARVRPDRTPAPPRPRHGRGTNPDSRSVREVRPRGRRPAIPVRRGPPRQCSDATDPIPGGRLRKGRRPRPASARWNSKPKWESSTERGSRFARSSRRPQPPESRSSGGNRERHPSRIGPKAPCASPRPLSRLTARTTGLYAAEAFRGPSVFRHVRLPPPLPCKATGVARDEESGVNAAPRSVPAAREGGVPPVSGSVPATLLSWPPAPLNAVRELRDDPSVPGVGAA